mgnify:CR=1 FL=1
MPYSLIQAASREKSAATPTRWQRTSRAASSAQNDNINAADWREWFRSSDYDDPWSPYHSFQTTVDSNKLSKRHTGDYQKTIISNVLDGTWERRRHGMNLEPLLMSYRGMDVEEYDGGLSKDDIANSNDSMEANDVAEENVTKARGRMRWMDTQTRFLCRMLDDLYRTGIRRESIRRCMITERK